MSADGIHRHDDWHKLVALTSGPGKQHWIRIAAELKTTISPADLLVGARGMQPARKIIAMSDRPDSARLTKCGEAQGRRWSKGCREEE